jgi:3-dehydroquinate synthase
MIIEVKTKQRKYPIIIERGALCKAAEIVYGEPDTGSTGSGTAKSGTAKSGTAGSDGTKRGIMEPGSKAFIVTDSGVPDQWKDILQKQFPSSPMFIFEQGEASKNISTYKEILSWLASNRASRKDTVIALGGGVTGDMAGFAAATYMRGISYINIPTTSLSQIDSSIGGKTAIDLDGLKNIVGAFWQPSAVIIYTDTLSTLPARQLAAGLAEAVKSGLIGDEKLFGMFEAIADTTEACLDEIIYRSLMVKKAIVEQDENEASIRKLLNLGHTYGHAYESYYEGRYLHGECVAMGMMTIIQDEEIRTRLGKVLKMLDLPISCDADKGRIAELVMSDKKAAGNHIEIAQVDEIGKAHLETWSIGKLREILETAQQ